MHAVRTETSSVIQALKGYWALKRQAEGGGKGKHADGRGSGTAGQLSLKWPSESQHGYMSNVKGLKPATERSHVQH